MSTLLDLIGSFIIGGMLLMMMLSTLSNSNQFTTEDQLKLNVLENMAEIVEIMEYDFRKIGYGVQNPALAVIRADTSSITFWSDLDNNGVLDSVRYRLSQPTSTHGTVNPRDRILYRSVNNQTIGGTAGVVEFKLTLYDIGGVVTTNPTLVKSLTYYMRVENPFPIDTVYARSAWRGTIRPRNL